MSEWQSVTSTPAPEGEVVETAIIDEHGHRDKRDLVRRGRLWFVPDESMYVYYRPTHWRTTK